MTQTAENVLVGSTGAVFFAPTGTTLPTNATTALNVAFTDVGYITEDGVDLAPESSSNKFKAWGGDVVRTVENEHSTTLSFAMMESNDTSCALYFGNGDADHAEIRGGQQVRGVFVVEVYDGDSVTRYVVPDGEVTQRQAIKLATTAPITYGITLEAYPNGVNKTKVHRYFDTDGVS